MQWSQPRVESSYCIRDAIVEIIVNDEVKLENPNGVRSCVAPCRWSEFWKCRDIHFQVNLPNFWD